MSIKTRVFQIILSLLLIVFTLFSLEGLFRVYEKYFLIHTAQFGESLYNLDALGYNDTKTVSSQKEPNVFRILSLGDSFAAAVTVPEYTYSHVIEKNLGEALSGKTIQVMNLGRDGTSMPEYIAQYNFWSQAVDYDAVIFNIYLGNDFTDFWNSNFLLTRHKTESITQTMSYGIGTKIPSHYPFRFMDYVYAIYKSMQYSTQQKGYRNGALQLPEDEFVGFMSIASKIYQLKSFPQLVNGFYWLDQLMQVANHIQQSGKHVVILISPPDFWYSQDCLQKVLKFEDIDASQLDRQLPRKFISYFIHRTDCQVPIIDMDEPFQRYADLGDELYWGTNTHWNIEGNKVAGNILSDYILENWFQVAQPKKFSDIYLSKNNTAPIEIDNPTRKVLNQVANQLDEQEINKEVFKTIAPITYRTQGELLEELRRAGFKRNEHIGGYLDLISRSPNSGLVIFRGWAINRENFSDPLYVCVFHQGKTAGLGKTELERNDVCQMFQIDPAIPCTPGYEFLVEIPITDLTDDHSLILVAFNQNKEFSVLSILPNAFQEMKSKG